MPRTKTGVGEPATASSTEESKVTVAPSTTPAAKKVEKPIVPASTEAKALSADEPRNIADFNYVQMGRVIGCPVCGLQARCDAGRTPICPTSVPGCPRGATD